MTDAEIASYLDAKRVVGLSLQLSDAANKSETIPFEIRDETIKLTPLKWAQIVATKFPAVSTKLFPIGSTDWWSVVYKTASDAVGRGVVDLSKISLEEMEEVVKVETKPQEIRVEKKEEIFDRQPQSSTVRQFEEKLDKNLEEKRELPQQPKPRPSEAIIAPLQEAAQMVEYQSWSSKLLDQFKSVWKGGATPKIEKAVSEGVVEGMAQAHEPMGFFAGLKKGLQLEKTAQAGEKTVSVTGKVMAKGVAWGLTKLGIEVGVNFAPVIGQAISLLLITKDILGGIGNGIKGLWNKVFPEAETTAHIGATKAVGWLSSNGGLAMGAVIGGILGGLVGSVVPGLGTAVGAGIGIFAGGLFGWGAGSAGGFGVGATGDLIAVFGGALTGQNVTPSRKAFVAALPFIIALSFVFFFGLFSWDNLEAAFLSNPATQGDDETSQVLFTIHKTANPATLPTYDGTATNIEYTVTVTPASNTVKIESINDPLASPKLDSTLLEQKYTYTISGDSFKNTNLINTVTVTGVDTATGKRETHSTSANVRINEPPTEQPYGYPAVGQVYSLDKYLGVSGSDQTHGSTFRSSPSCGYIPGGIDIVGPGGTDVVSTSKGTIIGANYEDVNSGGAIYVSSPPYTIEYLHLSQDSINKILSSGKSEVNRGEVIAQTSSKTYIILL